MKNKVKTQKGITLIILVVTIVVILILAGITVNLAFDENGIIKRAKGLQETINQSIANEEYELDKLKNHLEGSLINADIGGNPNINDIGGDGEESDVPQKPKIKVNGTQGEEGCYRSDVEIVVTANDRAHSLTYTVEGTGIDQGSISTEMSIGNGQSINITQDGTFTVTIYEYNRDGKKSEGMQVTITRDTASPTVTLAVTGTEEDSITVQLVAIDPEPSGGLASSTPYTFYYREKGSEIWIEAGKGSSSSYTYERLKENTGYELKAEVKDKAGNVGTSNEIADAKTGTNTQISGTTNWTKTEIKQDDETSFTITVNAPSKVEDGSKVTLEPNSTGSLVTIEPINPDNEGYTTKFKVTVTGGAGNGEEGVVIEEGALTDKNGNAITEMTKEGITVDNTKPGVGNITKPENGEDIKKGDTSQEIIITPSKPDVTINPDTFKPVDKDGNEITDPNTKVDVMQDDDGNIHITITGGDTEGGVNVEIQEGGITDSVGNENEKIIVDTGVKVDNTAPIMTISPASGAVTKTRNVMVTISDNGSGLSSSNNLTYYLSTSDTNPTEAGFQTGTYTSGTTFTLGTDLTGTYYLFLPIVADNAGNTSTATITGYYRCGTYLFDNTAPTINDVVLDTATAQGFNVTITATDTGEAGIESYIVYYKTSNATTYSNVTTTNATYTFTNLEAGTTYNVYVEAIDTVNNISQASTIKNITTSHNTISTSQSYVGYYADIDGNGSVDGIIYADLAVGGKDIGTFDLRANYEYSAVTEGLKEYYVSQTGYEGIFGTGDVLAPEGSGKDRFYVMALEDITPGTEYCWYHAAEYRLSNLVDIRDGDFGQGKTNTADVLAKWKAEEWGVQNDGGIYQDMWGAIEDEIKAGWFVPSKSEWVAFGELTTELGVTTSNYTTYGLSEDYWSSTQRYAGDDNEDGRRVYTVEFDGQLGLNDFIVISSLCVRLSATF